MQPAQRGRKCKGLGPHAGPRAVALLELRQRRRAVTREARITNRHKPVCTPAPPVAPMRIVFDRDVTAEREAFFRSADATLRIVANKTTLSACISAARSDPDAFKYVNDVEEWLRARRVHSSTIGRIIPDPVCATVVGAKPHPCAAATARRWASASLRGAAVPSTDLLGVQVRRSVRTTAGMPRVR